MIKTFWHIGVISFVLYAAYGTYMANLNRGTEYPQKPINVLIPYAAGGGTDTFVRFINKAVRDGNMMEQPIVVINKPGGSTTIGSSYVKYAKPDGYTVLCLHEALMTSKATGQSPHGPEAFEPIAATGEEGQMILVKEDSPFKSLKDLVKAAEEKPSTIKFGADLNSPPHFSGIMLEELSDGAKFRFVSTGGAAKRLSAILGGHIDAAIFMGSEYIRYKSMGLRALAYLGEERHPSKDINPIPTGAEQGYPVVNNNLQYWWFPKGTGQDKIDYFKGILKQAMKTEYVKGKLDDLKIIPRVIEGEELAARIKKKMAGFEEMKIEKTLKLPNIAAWTIGLVGLFSLIVLGKAFSKKGYPEEELIDDDKDLKLRHDYAIGISIMTVLYVLILSLQLVDFRIVTAVFVFFAGLFLTGFDKKKLVYTVEVALIMSLGIFFVFSEFFKIDMP